MTKTKTPSYNEVHYQQMGETVHVWHGNRRPETGIIYGRAFWNTQLHPALVGLGFILVEVKE